MHKTECYFQSPHNGRKTTNLDTQLAFLRKEMVSDLYCQMGYPLSVGLIGYPFFKSILSGEPQTDRYEPSLSAMVS